MKPSKCEIGFREIAFLGHSIGQGKVALVHSILEKIRDAQRPKIKRQAKSLLGLTSYYHDFIPDYATIASPLSDLTKKKDNQQCRLARGTGEQGFKTAWDVEQYLLPRIKDMFTSLKGNYWFPKLDLQDASQSTLVITDLGIDDFGLL